MMPDSKTARTGPGDPPQKIVSCIIMGGLANQLFEVANVLAFARRCGYVPVFDTSVTESPSMLEPAPTYWDTVFARAVALGGDARIDKERARTWPVPTYEYAEIDAEDDHVVFWGHFLSYRYFHDFRDHILDQILDHPPVRAEVDAAQGRIWSRILGHPRPLVSVHVRRGDSLKNGSLTRLSVDYYREASRVFPGACFLVFSDDIPWCRNNLDLAGDTLLVDGEKDYVDLMVMARCDHHIIANSTFSWWGAYLNRAPSPRVIYPYPWFTGAKHRNRDMSGFFPSGWEQFYSGDWFSL